MAGIFYFEIINRVVAARLFVLIKRRVCLQKQSQWIRSSRESSWGGPIIRGKEHYSQVLDENASRGSSIIHGLPMKGAFFKYSSSDFRYRLHSMVYKGVDEERFSVTPIFGQHYAVLKTGTVKVDDTLYIREHR